MIEHLDEFSRSFAEVLFREFPEFEKHARSDQGVLEIQFRPGLPREDSEFWLSTDFEEITIGFGKMHEHFDWPLRDPAQEWQDPIRAIRALVDEQELVVVKEVDGKWSGSTTIASSESLDTLALEPGESARILSWTGERDAVRVRGRS